jgi:cell wall-associated NlpC family hydrolase
VRFVTRPSLILILLGALVAGLLAPPAPARAAKLPSLARAAKPPSLADQINAASKQLEGIVEQYNKVNCELVRNQVAAAVLTRRVAATKKSVDAARAPVGRIAAQVYMSGSASPLLALVDPADTAQMLDRLAAVDQVAGRRRQRVDAALAVLHRFQDDQARLATLIAAETAQRASLATQKATITGKLDKLYALRIREYGRATAPRPKSEPTAPSIRGRGGVIVAFAYAQLGKPYVWAAAGPRSFDCSGLVLAAYGLVGIHLEHAVALIWPASRHIRRDQLKPGDLVFYENSSLHHIAIYIGGGRVIHAPTFGDHVKISPIDMMRPWGYGRL